MNGCFAVLGEPVVAVDLIDTIAVPGSRVADDLLSDDDNAAAWWRLESDRVPAGDIPDVHALRRLRAALREAIEAVIDGVPLPDGTVADLNFFIQSVPVSRSLVRTETGLRTETRWHNEYGGNKRLAFIAAQAAEFISDPARASRLRRCANPACWMIFVAVNPRRSWCVPGVCGNRTRVARHYRRDRRETMITWDQVNRDDVVRAIGEYDRLGPEAFFAAHGFSYATTYELVWDERRYPPKAILGTAYEFATGHRLESGDFEGGKSGAVRVLGKLGFTVQPKNL